jgi:hypothetical protein
MFGTRSPDGRGGRVLKSTTEEHKADGALFGHSFFEFLGARYDSVIQSSAFSAAPRESL